MTGGAARPCPSRYIARIIAIDAVSMQARVRYRPRDMVADRAARVAPGVASASPTGPVPSPGRFPLCSRRCQSALLPAAKGQCAVVRSSTRRASAGHLVILDDHIAGTRAICLPPREGVAAYDPANGAVVVGVSAADVGGHLGALLFEDNHQRKAVRPDREPAHVPLTSTTLGTVVAPPPVAQPTNSRPRRDDSQVLHRSPPSLYGCARLLSGAEVIDGILCFCEGAIRDGVRMNGFR
jgi:hypothetical protein